MKKCYYCKKRIFASEGIAHTMNFLDPAHSYCTETFLKGYYSAIYEENKGDTLKMSLEAEGIAKSKLGII